MWSRDERWRSHSTAQPPVYGRGAAILADGKLMVLVPKAHRYLITGSQTRWPLVRTGGVEIATLKGFEGKAGHHVRVLRSLSVTSWTAHPA